MYFINGKAVPKIIQKVFLMCASVPAKFDDIDINKIRKHDEKPRDQKQFYTLTTLLITVLITLFKSFRDNFRIEG